MARGRNSNARTKPRKPPPPPKGLSAEQAAVWISTCEQQTAEWLDTGPGPLLRAYCVVVVGIATAEVALSVGQASPDNSPKDILALLEVYRGWLGELGRLSRALRLTPQSRIRADKADNAPGMPWNDAGDADDESTD